MLDNDRSRQIAEHAYAPRPPVVPATERTPQDQGRHADRPTDQPTQLNNSTHHEPVRKPVQDDIRRRAENINKISILRRNEAVRSTREVPVVDKSHLVEFRLGRDAERAEDEVPGDIGDETPGDSCAYTGRARALSGIFDEVVQDEEVDREVDSIRYAGEDDSDEIGPFFPHVRAGLARRGKRGRERIRGRY